MTKRGDIKDTEHRKVQKEYMCYTKGMSSANPFIICTSVTLCRYTLRPSGIDYHLQLIHVLLNIANIIADGVGIFNSFGVENGWYCCICR